MIQIYRAEPYKTEHETVLDSVINEGHRTLVSCRENLFCIGGGQPADRGELIFDGVTLEILELIKHKGDLRLAVESYEGLVKGAKVTARIDWPRRHAIMRLHTAQHAIAGAARALVRGHYEQRPMQISEDAARCSMRFLSTDAITDAHVHRIRDAMDDAIAGDLEVSSLTYASVAAAQAAHAPIFRHDPRLDFKGNVRVVTIGGLDANVCGGTHCRSTAEIQSVVIEQAAFDRRSCECQIDFRLVH